MMIADPLDTELKEVIRIIETRDESTALAKAYLKISDRVAEMEEPEVGDFDLDDPQQAMIWKTVQILLNKIIYADGYLQQ